MTIKRPKLLLLDAGNTVVFLDHAAVAEAARDEGVKLDGETLLRAEPAAKRRYEAALQSGVSHEGGWHLFMRTLFEAAGVAEQLAERAARAARRFHDEFNLWRKVPDDLPDALARAHKAGVRTAIVSNSEGMLHDLLERVGVLHLFELVVDSHFEGVRKPDPEIFRRTLTRCQVAAEDALYAGDIPQVDVDGARAAGMDAVLIDPFNHYADYRDAPRFASVAQLVTAMGC